MPGLAGHEDEAPVGRRVATSREDRRQLVVPAHHREARTRRGRGSVDRVRRRGRGGRVRRDPAVADRLVQVGRLGERRHAELPLERRDARPVLADRRGAVAGPREERHQPAVGGLVERVELHPAAGGVDRQRPCRRRPRPRRRAGRGRARPCARRPWRAWHASRRTPGCRAARSRRATGRAPHRRPRRSARRSEDPAARSTSRRSTCSPAVLELDAGRGRRRSHRSPSAARSTDSVRRRAPRADMSSASGHSSAASSSRAKGRRSTTSRARIACALRVSTDERGAVDRDLERPEHADPQPVRGFVGTSAGHGVTVPRRRWIP